MVGESKIGGLVDGFQPHDARTMIERSCLRGEHHSHHVTLGTREYKVGIVAVLNSLSQGSFHGFLWIVGDGLKLIDGNQARFVGVLQVSENFVQCDVGNLDVTDAHAPLRIAINVEGDGGFERLQHVEKIFPYLSALRFEGSQYSLSQCINKLVEVLAVVDVDVDTMILLPDFFLIETVVYQPRLAQAPWSYQCHIASVGEMTGEQSRLFHSVAEVLWRQVAFDNERIRLYHNYSIMSFT